MAGRSATRDCSIIEKIGLGCAGEIEFVKGKHTMISLRGGGGCVDEDESCEGNCFLFFIFLIKQY